MGNTVDNIMDSCSEIPEFTIIKGPNAAKLILDSKDGAGEELFATVFPGVTLGYIDIGASSCPDAAPGGRAPSEDKLLHVGTRRDEDGQRLLLLCAGEGTDCEPAAPRGRTISREATTAG